MSKRAWDPDWEEGEVRGGRGGPKRAVATIEFSGWDAALPPAPRRPNSKRASPDGEGAGPGARRARRGDARPSVALFEGWSEGFDHCGLSHADAAEELSERLCYPVVALDPGASLGLGGGAAVVEVALAGARRPAWILVPPDASVADVAERLGLAASQAWAGPHPLPRPYRRIPVGVGPGRLARIGFTR